MLDLSLVLPCYNEEVIFTDSVRRIIKTLKQSRFSFEVIFVDDKSSDRTPQFVASVCKKYPFCRAIFHKKNIGRGRAVTDGILAARGRVVGYIDIDLEVSPVYIPEIVSLILRKKADIVIGRRMYRTSVKSIPREVLSRGYVWLADKIVRTGGLDTETGYKFFNRTKILPIVKKTRHPHWFWDTEIMVFARRAGLQIMEYPVLFLRRTDKQSLVHVTRDVIDYLLSLWRLRRRLAL